MTLSLTTKVITGSLASCVVVGSGIFIGSKYFEKESEKKSISSLLREKNPEKRLISRERNGSDTHWKAAWKSYLDSNSNAWFLNIGVVKKDGTDEAPSIFMDKCVDKSNELVGNESDSSYAQVLNYCTRDTQVSDLISENTSRKLLNSSDNQDDGEWTSAWKIYRDKNKAAGIEKDAWEFSDWNSTRDGDTLPTDYKSKCTTKATEKAFKLDDINYLNVLSWCTKD